MILLVAAVERELAGWTPRDGVDSLISGVGPVEAACAVAHALAQRRYKLVVNAGVAGAIADAAHVGDGVVVGSEYFELDLESGRPITLPGGEHVADSARSDERLAATLLAAGFPVLRGITGARVTTTDATAHRLAQLGAQIESMEGFAVLRAAQRAGVPAIELRGISNRVGERTQSGWDLEAGIAGMLRVLHALFRLLDDAAAPHLGLP